MTMQGRLLRLKKWYTLNDAARRLSVEIEEDVEIRDIVQFILDGDLQASISLFLVPATRKPPNSRPHENPKELYESCYISGTFHLHLSSAVIDAWRSWLQGGDAPNDDYFTYAGALWYITATHDAEQAFVPREITIQEKQIQGLVKAKKPPNINDWIIDRSDFNDFISSFHQQEAAEGGKEVESRPSHLLAIAALLDLLKNNKRYNYTQTSIIEELEDRNIGVRGVSKGNFTKLFADANTALREARKASQP